MVLPIIGSLDKSTALGETERWYLVHTLPRSELRAQYHLQAQGFRTYLPTLLKTTRHARQLRTARAPFFPRYLFVIIDIGRDRWLSIRSTFGVSSLLTCDDRPVAVPHGIVEALVERTNDDNLTRPNDGLMAGHQVRILSGALADFVGTLDRLDDNGRVRVLLQMMGGIVPVTIDRTNLLRSSS